MKYSNTCSKCNKYIGMYGSIKDKLCKFHYESIKLNRKTQSATSSRKIPKIKSNKKIISIFQTWIIVEKIKLGESLKKIIRLKNLVRSRPIIAWTIEREYRLADKMAGNIIRWEKEIQNLSTD